MSRLLCAPKPPPLLGGGFVSRTQPSLGAQHETPPQIWRGVSCRPAPRGFRSSYTITPVKHLNVIDFQWFSGPGSVLGEFWECPGRGLGWSRGLIIPKPLIFICFLALGEGRTERLTNPKSCQKR